MKERILEMLGNGVPQVAVAAALGVSESYISQLMGDPEFAEEVALRRFQQLQAHTARDSKYDSIEDKLLEKLEHALPQLMKPGEITGVLKVINAAKRRGVVQQELPVGQSQTVVLNIPQVLVNKFSTNIQQQVIEVAGKPLLTIPAEQLLKKVGASHDTNLITQERTGS